MDILDARIKSFKSKRIPKNPPSKSTSSSNTLLIKWPHPSTFKATPTTLAEAGFYHTPSVDYKDNVTCFCCGKDLNDWNQDDEPAEVHFAKCADTCWWATLKCGLILDLNGSGEYVGVDPSRLPSSKAMEKVRLQSFLSWPHDRVRGHGASSKKMAKAGFIYVPQAPDDDSASCLYCGITLNGWEPDDDPLEEHHKRDRKSDAVCIFFSAKLPSLGRSTARPPSGSSVRPKSRSKSARAKQNTPETEHSSDVEAEILPMSMRTTRSTKSRPEIVEPPSSGTSRRVTIGSKGKAAANGSEIEEQSNNDIGKAMKSKTRIIKRKGKIMATVGEEEENGQLDEEEDERLLHKSKRNNGKMKDVLENIEVEVELHASRKHQTQTRRQTRSRSKAKIITDSDAVGHKKPKINLTVSDSEYHDRGRTNNRIISSDSECGLSEAPARYTPKRDSSKPNAKPFPSRTKLQAPVSQSESSDAIVPPKNVGKKKLKAKSKSRVLESESEESYQSALEGEASGKLQQSTGMKHVNRMATSANGVGRVVKPSIDESSREVVAPSSMAESQYEETHKEHSIKQSRKVLSKAAPFHDKTTNRGLNSEVDMKLGSYTSRTSIGSKENATARVEERDDRSPRRAIIDLSDDMDDYLTKLPVSSKSPPVAVIPMAASTTSDSKKVKKKAEVAAEASAWKTTQDVLRSNKVSHDPDIVMDVDAGVEQHPAPSDTVAGQRSHKATGVETLLLGTVPTTQHEKDPQSTMDIDVEEPLPKLQTFARQSTPPRVGFIAESNPFTLPKHDASNPLLAFEAPYGKLPSETVFTLTEVEKEMTIEEWTKKELESQLEKFRQDGYKRIEEFKGKAAEVRRHILEAL